MFLCIYFSIVKGVILAGGKATRMGHHAMGLPKSMLKVGDLPILEHQINLFKKYSITDITILVNYLKEPILNYFGDGSKLGVSISFFEELVPLGTVGGIKEIEDQIKETFIVLYGDVMLNMDLDRLTAFHENKKSDATLVLHSNDHPYDSDLVETDNDSRIIRFYPKPHNPDTYYPNLVNAGVYMFSPIIFRYLKKGEKADFGRDVFPEIYKHIRMFGYKTSEYIKDMGTPERWEEVKRDYSSGKIQQSGYDHKQKAIFLDRDGVLNEEISFISKPDDLKLYHFTSDAIRKINKSNYKAIVVTNQSVIARNLCTPEELKVIHNKLETELGKYRAKLDAIYICPHHPDKGYPEERKEYKIDCRCRKPKPGMLFDAASDFNLDLNKSFIIGDSDRDVQAGVNAGCITVGVATGYGLKKCSILPDFFFTDLKEAVDFIVDDPYKPVFEKIKSSHVKTPFIILIGGNARSGKSTLASYLRLKLEQSNVSVMKIYLDNWILPEDQRKGCRNVYDRFQLDRIEREIQQILAGIKINIRQYSAHPEREPVNIDYQYSGEDLILIEGVVALSSVVIRNLAQYRIFVDINMKELRKRIQKFYTWRGKNNDEIEELYRQRLVDEYQLIEKERKLADVIVNSISK